MHSDLEADHASWSIDALASLGADVDAVYDAAHASALAWWSFLDERERRLRPLVPRGWSRCSETTPFETTLRDERCLTRS